MPNVPPSFDCEHPNAPKAIKELWDRYECSHLHLWASTTPPLSRTVSFWRSRASHLTPPPSG